MQRSEAAVGQSWRACGVLAYLIAVDVHPANLKKDWLMMTLACLDSRLHTYLVDYMPKARQASLITYG